MKYLLLVVLFLGFSARADLYRWVDRETGSVKFSNLPPPWFGDPERERSAPAVEVIRHRGPGAPPKPETAATSQVPALEARRTSLLQSLANTDFSRDSSALQQQIEAYQALSAELERLDPAGTPRRRAQEASAFTK